ncbi:uncharacterized protein C8Q71DRAFT_764232 [Rhodofomes roseus]|uniref:DUF6534 domain-containing protein n=1 Tax=Rhodofomes roseus TaxID=34475 RepID=A0ABQ8KCB0_9APHY|nr:uncharacterized protein C8Q71DRAFT_764232 [Rhodofomes roseus]KAH9835130.1 hypothetical protein C8Q71DRAFT_764232 [Rhodofomes roseus]
MVRISPIDPSHAHTEHHYCLATATALESCYEISTLKIFASAFESGHLWIMYYSLSIASCIDIFIAASLCYLLSRCRTGFCKTDSLISWLMFYTINTGLVTSMCSLVAVIMLAVFPRTFLTVAFQFVQVKLYINSYLAMLNARSSLRRHRDGSLGGGLSIPRSMIFMPSNSAGEANGVTIIPDPCNSNPSVRVQSNTRTGRHSSMSVEIDPRRDAHGGVLHIYKDASLAQSHETLVVINTRLRDSCPHVDADNNPYDNRRPTVRRPSPTFARRTSVVFI